ncbi:MAG: RHS repeat-associated core domain-containing protein, partial [Saprospiraceae bacterium]
NILTLTRKGLIDNGNCYSISDIDDLDYNYENNGSSNRLKKVVDTADPCLINFTIPSVNNLAGLYGVKNDLLSTDKIDADDHTEYTAGNGITLNSGFEVPINTTFLADIRNCISSGNNLGFGQTGFSYSNPDEDYTYNDDGDLTRDPNRRINLTYNHLHLIDQIDFDDGRKITFLYEATGRLLKKQLFEAGSNTPMQTKDYVQGGVELLDGVVEFVSHGEGRSYYNGSTFKDQYILSDHLGNSHIMFSDVDGNGSIRPDTEVLQENHYYGFGLNMYGPWKNSANLENEYQYNGIDYLDDFGLNFNMATFRVLDPALGRWLQVDPKAEVTKGLSPYNSMNNNPISNADPDGDSPILIGAAIGFLSNGIGNAINGENFFKGGLQAAAFGAIGGGISSGIGGVASGIGNGFERAAFQFGAHAISGGGLSAAQGGSFWSGAAAGGFSSGVGSGIGALGGGGFEQWLGGGLSGGVGSSLAGGSFLQGAGQGLITGGLNHAAHSITESLNRPDVLPDGRMLWELSDSEFAQFHSAEGRAALFSGEFDIQLSVAERAYWFGKKLGLAAPSTKLAASFGSTLFRSKGLGYRSKLFGRKSPYLSDGQKGKFNTGEIRTGGGWNGSNQVFRTGVGTGRHIDWFIGPKM